MSEFLLSPIPIFHCFTRSLVASTWCAPLPGPMRRKYFAAVLSAAVLLSSLMAMMPICCLARSGWILTPSWKFRLKRFGQATTMLSLGRARGN